MKRSTVSNASKIINNQQTFPVPLPDNREFFVGIVREVVTRDSQYRTELDGATQQSEYFDNRYTVLVTPLDSPYQESLIEAHFVNGSHQIDVPVENEAVLCIKTVVGVLIHDRLSMYGYGVNNDNQVYLLSRYGTQITQQNTDYNSFKKERIQNVLPWFYKKGCTYNIGRNNQYLIFDAGFRELASEGEKEATSDGKYIKMGFKKPKNSEDSSSDPSSAVICSDASIFDLFATKINSNNFSEDEALTNGAGIQTDDLVFIGRNLVVFYSLNKFIIKGRDVFIEANNLVELEAPRINLGSGAQNRAVSGEDLLAILGDVQGILRSMATGSLVSPAGVVTLRPDVVQKINQLQASYRLNSPNSSRLLSQKIYVSK